MCSAHRDNASASLPRVPSPSRSTSRPEQIDRGRLSRVNAVRALVTGGAGFIGSHLVDALVDRGDEVHVLDNLTTGSRDFVSIRTTLHEGDIRTDARSVFDAVEPELCFHLAAQADVATSVAQPDYDAEVNVVGTVRVLEAARAHGAQVVFSSTGGAIYGECDGPAGEEAPRRPISPYGLSKLACEEYLAGWNRLFGERHVALRFANVYGPRQAATLEGGVVSIFLERIAAGEPPTIFGDGGQTRDFVYVADVVRGILAAVGHEGGVFNIGSGVETSVNELYTACARAAGSTAAQSYGPTRPGDVVRSVIDPTRARAELGWQPQVSLDDGLRATLEWLTKE
jgi:UDP-glucose 4-epimerase